MERALLFFPTKGRDNMKATTAGVAALVLGSSLAAMGGGCSSGDESSLLGDANAGGGRRGSGTSQDPTEPPLEPTDAGHASDAGDAATIDATTADAAQEAAAPLPPGANKVPCGGSECNTLTHACCHPFGSANVSCIPANAACNGGAKASCDAKEDCVGATICCFSIYGAQCQTACDVNQSQYQICKTNSECANGKCYVNECTASNGQKYTVASCLMLPGCTAK